MIIYEDGEQYNVPTKWLEEHNAKVRADAIKGVRTKIIKITDEHIEKYGADIIELYTDVVSEFKEWLVEQLKEE